MNFQPGDIGFVMHHKNPISRLIAWFMGSRWSHSFVVLGDLHGLTQIRETSDFQIVTSSLARYLNEPSDSVCILRLSEFTDSERAQMAARVMAEEALYGYLQLPSLGFRRLLMRAGIRIKNVIRQGVACCAVPMIAMNATAKYQDLDPESIDTEELFQMLLADDWEIVFEKRAI